MNCCFATIVSTNYLAYAKVLSASLAQYAPACSFRVLIVDRASEACRELVFQTGLDAVFAEELGLADFERLAYKYDLVELNTALKPTFLRRLLESEFERVIYLDPDVLVCGSIAPLLSALDDASVVLTPHSMTPVLDGHRPSDVDCLRNGTFN